jgi:hypothetical protein
MIVSLADNYAFNADEAYAYVQHTKTGTNHLEEIFKLMGVKMENTELNDKIATCKKNIALWEQKLSDGKVKDADKQREKIEKEKAKLTKLEASVPKEEPVKEEKPVVEKKTKAAPKKKAAEEAPAEKPKKAEETTTKEKRIKRFSPVMTSQLKTALEGVKLEMNDKIKKEFQQYIEDLSDDDYRASGLADHMREFAKLKAPAPVPVKVETDLETLDEVPTKTAPIFEPPAGASNAVGGGPTVQMLSLAELQSISLTASIDPPGTFWDADKGRFVRGPDADDDEDFVEIKFETKEYVVGEKTGRVYEARDSGDVFTGFVGVGKFKGMKMP